MENNVAVIWTKRWPCTFPVTALFVDLTFILMAQPNKENSCYAVQCCSHLTVVSRLLHPLPGRMFSSMILWNLRLLLWNSDAKLTPAAKQKLLLSNRHWQCSDTDHNESALVVSVSDIREGRGILGLLRVVRQPSFWKIRITSFRKRTPMKA